MNDFETAPILPFDVLPETLTEPPLIVGVRLNRRWLTQEELREARAKGAEWYATQRAAWRASQQAANVVPPETIEETATVEPLMEG